MGSKPPRRWNPPTFLLFTIFAALVSPLSMFAAELTNSVAITTNLTLFLKGVGTKEQGPASELRSDREIAYVLETTGTNYVWFRHFPYGNFDFHLFDGSGAEVRKTKAGLDMTATPPHPTLDEFRTRRFSARGINSESGEFMPLFRPDDVFVITNNGVYDLEVRLHLCVILTNGEPDMGAMLDARNFNGRGLQSTNQIGILTSPPLRVRVTKEK